MGESALAMLWGLVRRFANAIPRELAAAPTPAHPKKVRRLMDIWIAIYLRRYID